MVVRGGMMLFGVVANLKTQRTRRTAAEDAENGAGNAENGR
jgi:hypothetical protein